MAMAVASGRGHAGRVALSAGSGNFADFTEADCAL